LSSNCYTCAIVAKEVNPLGGIILLSKEILVNHYGNLDNEPNRAGWIIVSPVRHITHVFELTDLERQSLTSTISEVDRILVELYGSRRTMVASLGWLVDDHVHFHVVPTFGETVSNGYLNFGDAYVPVPESIEDISENIRSILNS
jgi:diadenosine tetraphosphate (Ap4A) HIT family hydrolase